MCFAIYPPSIYSTPSWIIGTILGDAYIDKSGRLYLEHSIKQEEYFLWKYQKLLSIGAISGKPVKRTRLIEKSGNDRNSIYLRSKPIFLGERDYFYPFEKKQIPVDFGSRLDAEALAVWFMDDGGRNSGRGSGMVIDVSGYSEECRVRLKQILTSKFGLETTFHRREEAKKTSKYIFVRQVLLDFVILFDLGFSLP